MEMRMGGPTTDHGVIRHWAEANQALPVEVLPSHVDSLPTVLHVMLPAMVRDRPDVRVMTWEEFFVKFDLMGLTFVYDEDSTGYNELLQVEERSPYRSPHDVVGVDRNN